MSCRTRHFSLTMRACVSTWATDGMASASCARYCAAAHLREALAIAQATRPR